MKKLIMMTTAVGLCLAAPAFAQTPAATPTADQKGLVTVNLQDVLNNLSADLKIDRANIPVTAQIPINAAANVCGVSVNVLSAQAASSPASCNAKTGSQELTQAVQQQMAAGGTAAGQTGTTAAVSNPPASTAPAAGTAARPAATANAPAAAPAANPLAQNSTAPAQQNAAPAQQNALGTAAPAQQNIAPAQQNAQVPAARAPAQQNAQGTAAPAQQNAQGMTAPAQQNAQGMAAPAQQNAQGMAAPAQQNAQAPQGAAPAAAQNAQSAPAAAGNSTAQGMAQPASASITLDQQQQSRIAEVFTKQNIKPANVTFAINTGAAVPASVTLAAVPASVVQIAPQFRGYSYFATNDRIVIVEPTKKTVVAVIPNGSGARAQAAPAAKQVQFTDQQREVIRKRASSQKAVTTGSAKTVTKRYSVQERIPEDVTLEEFSEDVVREVPTTKSYRYYRQDNDVVVVDPGERRVIEVIR
jgi:hypothetical protein